MTYKDFAVAISKGLTIAHIRSSLVAPFCVSIETPWPMVIKRINCPREQATVSAKPRPKLYPSSTSSKHIRQHVTLWETCYCHFWKKRTAWVPKTNWRHSIHEVSAGSPVSKGITLSHRWTQPWDPLLTLYLSQKAKLVNRPQNWSESGYFLSPAYNRSSLILTLQSRREWQLSEKTPHFSTGQRKTFLFFNNLSTSLQGLALRALYKGKLIVHYKRECFSHGPFKEPAFISSLNLLTYISWPHDFSTDQKQRTSPPFIF